MKKPIVFLLTTLFLFTRCGDVGYTYSDYHCNFSFDNSTHLDPTLASAMNSVSTGIFCRISYTLRSGGVKYFVFRNSNGDSSETIFNAIDERMESQKHLGMAYNDANNNGIIVGYSVYDGQFLAYDLQCPKCYNMNAIPMRTYPLNLKPAGIAECNNCKLTFDLNNSGNGLTRYRATTTGPQGSLHVF